MRPIAVSLLLFVGCSHCTRETAQIVREQFPSGVLKTVVPVDSEIGFHVGTAVMLRCKKGLPGVAFTAKHVVSGSKIHSRFIHGRPLSLTRHHPKADLSIIMLPPMPKDCPVARVAPFDPERGSVVVGAGSALGTTGSVTMGVVSAPLLSSDGWWILRITAPILPGHSGGGLFNIKGELVGIVSHFLAVRGVPVPGTGAAVHTKYLREMWREFDG